MREPVIKTVTTQEEMSVREVRIVSYGSLKKGAWFIYFASDGEGYLIKKEPGRSGIAMGIGGYHSGDLPPETMVFPINNTAVIPGLRERGQ